MLLQVLVLQAKYTHTHTHTQNIQGVNLVGGRRHSPKRQAKKEEE